jgi:hypothetical protein
MDDGLEDDVNRSLVSLPKPSKRLFQTLIRRQSRRLGWEPASLSHALILNIRVEPASQDKGFKVINGIIIQLHDGDSVFRHPIGDLFHGSRQGEA